MGPINVRTYVYRQQGNKISPQISKNATIILLLLYCSWTIISSQYFIILSISDLNEASNTLFVTFSTRLDLKLQVSALAVRYLQTILPKHCQCWHCCPARALASLCVQLSHALSPHCAAEVLVNTAANNTTPAPTSGTWRNAIQRAGAWSAVAVDGQERWSKGKYQVPGLWAARSPSLQSVLPAKQFRLLW